MNKLLVMSGIPGSGKSHISLLIKEKRNNSHVYVVSSDKIRSLIGGHQQNLANDDLVWKMYYELAKVFSLDKNGIVILDSTNVQREFRINRVKPIIDRFDEIDLVIFKLDKETILKQNINREFPVPDHDLQEFFRKFEDVNDEDRAFFDNIYVIDNKKDLDPIIADIAK